MACFRRRKKPPKRSCLPPENESSKNASYSKMASSMGKILGKMQVSSSFGVIDPKKTLRYPHHPPFVPWSRVRFHRDFDLHVGGPRKSTMSVMSVMAVRKKEVSYGRYPRHNAGDSPFQFSIVTQKQT